MTSKRKKVSSPDPSVYKSRLAGAREISPPRRYVLGLLPRHIQTSLASYTRQSNPINELVKRMKPSETLLQRSILRLSGQLHRGIRTMQRDLDEAFKNAPRLRRPMIVYAGKDWDFPSKPRHGYVSTSRDIKFAHSYATESNTTSSSIWKSVYQITIPKGSKILPIADVSDYPDEDEILLDRGGTFTPNPKRDRINIPDVGTVYRLNYKPRSR